MIRTEEPLPLRPADIVDAGLCIGCGSCVAAAADARGMTMNRYGLIEPTAPDAISIEPRLFGGICPFSPEAPDEDSLAADLFPDAGVHHPATGRYEAAYVGAASAGGFREEGSSGGLVTWTLIQLLKGGEIDGVAHVIPTDPATGRFFRYRISRTEDEIRQGARSRYYPVELSGALAEIRASPGRYAVVGVPCFVKAVQLLRRWDPIVRERVVATLGLFCGHMKSARFVESFAWQMGVPLADVQAVEFRHKDPARPASTYTAVLTLRDGASVRRDWWDLVDGDWGSGFFQSPACDYCDDVVAEVADISFGDAWVEPYSSDGRGTNVVIARSPPMRRLIEAGIRDRALELRRVDGAFIQETQAAGLRQRREGLAYRLAAWPTDPPAHKRIAPDRYLPTPRRRLIYRMRRTISRWSHRVFHIARVTKLPSIYTRWAAAAVTIYHALAYSRGRLGSVVDEIGDRLRLW